MQILEGSDTRLRFKIKEMENNIQYDLDLGNYTEYKLEIKFSDDSFLEVDGVVDTISNTLYFDIFGEMTTGKEGALYADIRGLNGVKKVRFNEATIKGKILDSVYVPNGLQNN